MANIKQQVKRNRTNEKRRQANHAFMSSLKSAIKAVEAAVEAKDQEAASTAVSFASKKLDKAQAKGLIHKNFVARKKSQLARSVNSIA